MSSDANGAPLRRIGILTGGGDAPGLNAVIRAVVKSATHIHCEVIGLEDSFDGLIESNRWRKLTPRDVTGILRIGGTILGTVNRGNPLAVPIETTGGLRDYSERCVEVFHELKLDALVVIGGDGTLALAFEFHKRGIPIVCVPKTIDNDIVETTNTFGFDTAVGFATDAIDRLHTTAEAHHRVMVVEVMGRYAGWIALYAGVAGGADVILIPEIPFDLEKVTESIRGRDLFGARFSIVVVAEGAKPVGGSVSLLKAASGEYSERLGGSAYGLPRSSNGSPEKKPGWSCSDTCSAAARPRASTGCWRHGSAPAPWSCCTNGISARWWRFILPTSWGCRSRRSWAARAMCRSTSTCFGPRARWAFHSEIES